MRRVLNCALAAAWSLIPRAAPPLSVLPRSGEAERAPNQVAARATGATVRSGLDVLLSNRADLLEGRRCGVIAHAPSRTSTGTLIWRALEQIPGCSVAALFAPEHGLGLPADSLPPGIAVHDLYTVPRKPKTEALAGLDLLVIDLQDAGVRFYTYESTLILALEAAAGAGLPVVVCDRPNPIGGEIVEGTLLDPRFVSFVGLLPLPIRHGLTMGELALYVNGEGLLPAGARASLTVIPCAGWRRGMTWAETGLPWIPPSPNLLSPEAALLYPGLCLLEGTNVSEGRGTDLPFELLGAPWIDPPRLSERLEEDPPPGVAWRDTTFVPRSIPGRAPTPKHEGVPCAGLRLWATDPRQLRSVALGVHLLAALRAAHPEEFRWREDLHIDRLAGTDALRRAIDQGTAAEAIVAGWAPDEEAFRAARAPYLLYP